MKARRYAWLLAACMMVSAGCSATPDDRLNSSVGLLDITPVPTPQTPTPPAPTCKPDYLASLRPEGPLPSPNNLPAGSFISVIHKRGFLIVGVDQNTKLLGYYNPNTKQFEGFDIDLAHEIAKAIFGADWMKRIHYVALLTGQRIPFVQHDKVDIVADAVTITCKRTKDVIVLECLFPGPPAGTRSIGFKCKNAAGPSWQEGLRDDRVDSGGNQPTWRGALSRQCPHGLSRGATAGIRRRHSD